MKPKRQNSKPSIKLSREQNATIRKIIKLKKLVWKVAQRRDAVAFQEFVSADAVMIFQSGVDPHHEVIQRYRLISSMVRCGTHTSTGKDILPNENEQ